MAIVKIYSTPSCPYCEILKQFLYEKGVKFEVIDVSDNEEAQNYIFEKTGKMAVPVTEIDDEIVIGFDKQKIMELLRLKD
ncbi:glutathione S-transferase N-terminal domain-containing protein [Patescibacteria group bacterium]|nr:glutathione S-transferase N-terminal domain-containing protein [Patescibacteria group bacterium]MBU4162149.1 glutathione S-transferase N-terminal domain-containing protein [Patescibacteria group bacterium]